jgi:phosphoglycolate phosphatase-like HAD superfamily hydrolase
METTYNEPASPLAVGIDIDGCLYDFVGAVRRYRVQVYGLDQATMPPARQWAFFTDWGMSLQEFLADVHAGVEAGVIFGEGDPLPGVVDALGALAGAGHSLHLVTDRGSWGSPGRALELTHAWLEAHGVPFDTLTIAADKTTVPCQVFIEDRPENFTALRQAGVDAYLRSWPYNEHVPTPPGRRVADLTQFARAVTGVTVPA